MRQLLPARARVGLERLERLIEDVGTALTRPKKPPSTTRSLRDEARRERDAVDDARPRADRDVTRSEPSDDTDATRRVVFEHLGQEVTVGPDQTILDAGREAGLDLEFSCTVGGCAACALQIVDGEVVYDVPTCLSDDELESGMCLACVGRPDGELVLTERF